MRLSLKESDLGFYILTPRYNLRPQFRCILGKGDTSKIVHIRYEVIDSWVKPINQNKNILRVCETTWEYFESGYLVVIRGKFIKKLIICFLKALLLLGRYSLKKF